MSRWQAPAIQPGDHVRANVRARVVGRDEAVETFPIGSASVATGGGRGVSGIHLFLLGEPPRLALPRRRR